MTFLNDTYTGRADLAHTVSLWIERAREGLAKRSLRRQTLRELGELSNRELNDIGISRAAIPGIAYETAYGTEK